MQSFHELSELYNDFFSVSHFPDEPANLYEPNNYFLQSGGKRLRPVMVLMGNQLFDEITGDAWQIANAVELFHNFTLMHDDIMDNSSVRRGKETVYVRNGVNTAILSGDVMLVKAFEYLNNIERKYSRQITQEFCKVAAEVCEGQQLDMDFEKRENVTLEDYKEMIRLKTAVLLASSLRLGAVVGGAGKGNQDTIYKFGEAIGIAFQVQDDYLDAFGKQEVFGKKRGGDIIQNKKTFLTLHTRELASESQKAELKRLADTPDTEKVNGTLEIMKACGVDTWARELKQEYYDNAMNYLDQIAVVSPRKKELRDLASYLLERDR